MIGHRPNLGVMYLGLQAASVSLTERILATIPRPPAIVFVIEPYRTTRFEDEMADLNESIRRITTPTRPVFWEDQSLKARQHRFQEFTRSLHGDARFTGIRPAGRPVTRKTGPRAREQRTKRKP